MAQIRKKTWIKERFLDAKEAEEPGLLEAINDVLVSDFESEDEEMNEKEFEDQVLSPEGVVKTGGSPPKGEGSSKVGLEDKMSPMDLDNQEPKNSVVANSEKMASPVTKGDQVRSKEKSQSRKSFVESKLPSPQQTDMGETFVKSKYAGQPVGSLLQETKEMKEVVVDFVGRFEDIIQELARRHSSSRSFSQNDAAKLKELKAELKKEQEKSRMRMAEHEYLQGEIRDKSEKV